MGKKEKVGQMNGQQTFAVCASLVPLPPFPVITSPEETWGAIPTLVVIHELHVARTPIPGTPWALEPMTKAFIDQDIFLVTVIDWDVHSLTKAQGPYPRSCWDF